ncbi:MAG TPA: alanine--tRNA ligase-related protein, partial [Solirubrobacteraceae bacterium]|nr:alanine--tRNA ligase-related protein [Solirubrobacteraceae bacterium]
EAVRKWTGSEEEGFGRTLEQGSRLLDELIARALQNGDEGIAAADAFLLHDTHGFPIDLTLELVAEHGLGVDEQGFEALMDDQRTKSRTGAGRGGRAAASLREHALALAGEAGFATDFKGYETTDVHTTVGALARDDGRLLVKLVESPFYATGGGQIADSGWVECEDGDCLARVDDVLRLGEDQVVALVAERGELKFGERVRARVDHRTRHATECNHTATHLLHAALRSRLGAHVRQAGSYVGPDKLRFDFTHGSSLSPAELADVEQAVNGWILESHPVRALSTTLSEARALGAMALFGEKYGDVVRMVEIGDGSFSRELCGGTHVRTTSEIAVLKVLSESSSAANVRRIEAVTGPAAVTLLRGHDAALGDAARALRVPPEQVPEAVGELRDRVRELERAPRAAAAVDLDGLLAGAVELAGARVIAAAVAWSEGLKLLEVADTLLARLGEGAVVLGAAGAEKVDLVARVSPALERRGVRADVVVRAAAAVVGGGGGGRPSAARAGGREPAKLPQALAAARAAIEAALEG